MIIIQTSPGYLFANNTGSRTVPFRKQIVLPAITFGERHGAQRGARFCLLIWKLNFMDTSRAEQKISSALGNQDKREGPVARTIEEQTSKLPSDLFLWAAGASMVASLALKVSGHKHTALFVGQWAAPFLLLGIYNKIVKVAGHDEES